MKLTKIILALGLMAATLSPAFAADDEELEARCREYAQEDGVKGDELDAYIAECIAEMKKSESAAGDDAPAEKD